MKYLGDILDKLSLANQKKIFDMIYPVGSIYMSVNSTNPKDLFGGEWIAWGAGRVPVGVDTSQSYFDTVEEQGGSADAVVVEHNHPQNSHTHNQVDGKWSVLTFTGTRSTDTVGEISGTGYKVSKINSDGSWSSTLVNGSTTATNQAAGVSGTGKNLQPYITCYMWKRTA